MAKRRSRSRTTLQKHVDFFDSDHDGTRQRLKRFYDGSLFYQLADEVAAKRAGATASLFTAVGNRLGELY